MTPIRIRDAAARLGFLAAPVHPVDALVGTWSTKHDEEESIGFLTLQNGTNPAQVGTRSTIAPKQEMPPPTIFGQYCSRQADRNVKQIDVNS
jgi:hypothetical protein